MINLSELAERIEALHGSDREIDCLIKQIATPDLEIMTDGGSYDGKRNAEYVKLKDLDLSDWEDWQGMGIQIEAPAYTASIDAAMTLVSNDNLTREIVYGPWIPGWVTITNAETGKTYDGEAITPELALCAAALRAMDR